jgi:hypothetical protein
MAKVLSKAGIITGTDPEKNRLQRIFDRKALESVACKV